MQWVRGWGSLKSERVKYGYESHETQTQEWLHWWGPATLVNDRPVFSSERAPHMNKPENYDQFSILRANTCQFYRFTFKI
jgi:hypothetical protein